jgi:ubiquinone/menaquinone biosynthesis C-methylase UbiE
VCPALVNSGKGVCYNSRIWRKTFMKLLPKGINSLQMLMTEDARCTPWMRSNILCGNWAGGNASTVVDLGAGTGKFTKLLVSSAPRGARVIAVEPVEGMRKKFASLLPMVELLAGSAEHIPLETNWVDAVVVAQAFQWFNGIAALQEIYRALKPGGSLGLIWNATDESMDWMAKIAGLTGHEMVIDRVASRSYIAALPEAERKRVLDQVRELLSTHPQTKGKGTVEIKYRTDVFWCQSTKRL